MPEEHGTYVERSGLAVVHSGERIVAASGSEAALTSDFAAQAVHYYFPVEVVVVGDIGEEVAWEIEQRMWQRLHDALA
jgi:hypothetical protein